MGLPHKSGNYAKTVFKSCSFVKFQADANLASHFLKPLQGLVTPSKAYGSAKIHQAARSTTIRQGE